MITIYLVSIDHDELGAVEGFFKESGDLIDAWSLDDADWRGEYFNSTFENLGIKIEDKDASDDMINEFKKYFGV